MTPLKPLSGKRVVSIALNVPGPMAAERLRDLGAEVTKVEPPSGDPLRHSAPVWYAELTRAMAVETCDLKSPAGRMQMHKLLMGADVLLTSQRPAALARLGLAWDTLQDRFPMLCQVAIVGHRSPQADEAGHDLTYLAANDLLQPPTLPPTLFADVAGSEQAALSALAVLMERERTGTGHYIEVALAEAAQRLAAPRAAGLTLPGAILGGGFPGYRIYRTSDGWIAVAALESHFYDRLLKELGVISPNEKELADRFVKETTVYWCDFARRHDLPVAAVAYTAS